MGGSSEGIEKGSGGACTDNPVRVEKIEEENVYLITYLTPEGMKGEIAAPHSEETEDNDAHERETVTKL